MARARGLSSCCSGRGGYSSSSSSGAGDGVERSATAFWSLSASVGVGVGWEGLGLPAAAAREGLVILLGLGPKARVCWARAVAAEGLRRVGGMFVGWVMIDLGGVKRVVVGVGVRREVFNMWIDMTLRNGRVDGC